MKAKEEGQPSQKPESPSYTIENDPHSYNHCGVGEEQQKPLRVSAIILRALMAACYAINAFLDFCAPGKQQGMMKNEP